MKSHLVLAGFLLLLVTRTQSIRWYHEPNSVKCLREEIPGNVLVSGEYDINEIPGQKINFVAQDTKNHILAQKEDVPHGKTLKFSFVTETSDVIEICFISHVSNNIRGIRHEVGLNVKKGIEAKSYEGIAEVSKLKPIELDLKQLEDLSEAIVQDFARMRKNEEEMRDTNETTNSRVLFFSVFSMFCLLSLALWQVMYLRRFFKAKKLIE